MRPANCTSASGLALGQLAILLAWTANANPPRLPEGDGRDLAERTCSQCHSLELVLKHHMTRRQWEAQLDTMIAKGAKLGDDDFDALAAYLAATLGPDGAN